ncbi:DMT family transporter [Caldalkalibacillus mannanilyticus]|uniref:DMT family transporter n=1 Tax=Caldalkalibacillus mannanilyticus TaxID=1418 RepID=UPI000AF0119A
MKDKNVKCHRSVIMSDRNKGIFLLLLSGFGFALMAAFIKLSGDLPTVQKTLFRNLISCIIAFGLVIYYRESFFGKRENQKWLVLRSVFGLIGVILNFYSIDHLILSDAEMLNKLSPFLLIIFAAVFLKEKVKTYQLTAVLIAFAGTLFVIKPKLDFEMIPYLAGILGAVFAALAYTILRILGSREKPYTVVFYFSFFSVIAMLPFVFLTYKPMTGSQLAFLILAGLFATLGQFGVTMPTNTHQHVRYPFSFIPVLYLLPF